MIDFSSVKHRLISAFVDKKLSATKLNSSEAHLVNLIGLNQNKLNIDARSYDKVFDLIDLGSVYLRVDERLEREGCIEGSVNKWGFIEGVEESLGVQGENNVDTQISKKEENLDENLNHSSKKVVDENLRESLNHSSKKGVNDSSNESRPSNDRSEKVDQLVRPAEKSIKLLDSGDFTNSTDSLNLKHNLDSSSNSDNNLTGEFLNGLVLDIRLNNFVSDSQSLKSLSNNDTSKRSSNAATNVDQLLSNATISLENDATGADKLSNSDSEAKSSSNLVSGAVSLNNSVSEKKDSSLKNVLLDIKASKEKDVQSLLDKTQNIEPSSTSLSSAPFGYDDFLVQELLKYFKNDFFTWVNKPRCCSDSESDIESLGAKRFNNPINPDKIQIIELYKCNKCGKNLEFPRIGNPVTLLKTRKGRCGEWADCFVLILAALIGVERVRYIWNFEDHVWSEYYSLTQKRWIHLDPCEACFDEPLLYSDNWGKEMSWVIGLNHNYIIDLSKKYINPKKQKSLSDYNIKKVHKAIDSLNYQKNRHLTREEYYYQILVPINLEMNSFDPETTKTRVETKGRQTGSVEWLKGRGESGT